MRMKRSDEGLGSGAARLRGLAVCLAAILCAGCAAGSEWWRPPKPRAGAMVPAAPGVIRDAAGGDKIRITTFDLAQAAGPASLHY